MEKVEVLIPCRLDYLAVLAKLVEALEGPLGFNEEEMFAISTALVEAGTNAVQHGGKLSHEPFRVVVEGDEQKLVMNIYDHGPGFDIALVDTHVTDEDHIYNSRGRGIFIMKSLMTQVNYSFGQGKGTCLTLVLDRKANGA